MTKPMHRLTTIGLMILTTAAWLVANGQSSSEAENLSSNKTIEREMQGAQTHHYKVELKANDFLQVCVEQKGIDVIVRLFDSKNRLVADLDSPNGARGFENLIFISTEGGSHIVEVATLDNTAPKGSYSIVVAPLRQATPRDRQYLEKKTLAKTSLAEAGELAQQRTTGSYRGALEKYLLAIRLFREIGDKSDEAASFFQAGQISVDLNQLQDALEYYSQNLLLVRALSEKRNESVTLYNIGEVYSALGQKEQSLSVLNQSLLLAREVSDLEGEVEALLKIAKIYVDLGEPQRALGSFTQALSLLDSSAAKSIKVAVALTGMGLVYGVLGERQKALEYFNQALLFYREANDKESESSVLNSIGNIHKDLGDQKKALEYFNQALLLSRQAGAKESESNVLNSIGNIHKDLGDKERALEYFNQGLALVRSQGIKAQEANALNHIGDAYLYLGEKQRALESHEQALLAARAVNNRAQEAIALNFIGVVYRNLGEKEKALEYYTRSLQVARTASAALQEVDALITIGSHFSDLGEKQKALDSFDNALVISRRIKDKKTEIAALLNIGRVHQDLARQGKALEAFNQALLLAQALTDKSQEGAALNNIGESYRDLGDRQKALESLFQSLQLFRTVKNRAAEATVLSNIGSVYRDLGELQKALENYNQASLVGREVGYKSGEATTLNNIGTVYLDRGENQNALEYFNKALLVVQVFGEKQHEAIALSNIMYALASLQRPEAGILFGKQSVNLFQQLRQSLQGLDRETQKNYLKILEGTYRRLADLLIGQGRFRQAEDVLSMLKEEEYFEFVRRDSTELSKLEERVPLNEKEKSLIGRYSLLANRITELGREFVRLEDKKRQLSRNGQVLSSQEQNRYDELEKLLDTANAAFQLFLNKVLFVESGRERVEAIEIDRNLQSNLRKWGEGTVALYTVAGSERYRIVMTTSKVQVDGKTEIKSADLNKKVFAFRAALQNPQIDPRPLGKELYDILIKPIEPELKAANAKTLIWSLDGTLRYLPLAALSPDGKRYVVEDYQNVIITSKTRDDLLESNVTWKALGLGVSEAQIVSVPEDRTRKVSFNSLPGTERELLAIVKEEKSESETGVLPGRRFINNEFTTKKLKEWLSMETEDGKRKYNIVHIASHFSLGNTWSNSFLLLGNGEILTLEEINNSSTISFGDVELVTLSACNTGVTDNTNGKEVDSLASVIQTKSGKAVLATLWAVADESTALLMKEFYRLRKENPQLTKATALQMAQKEMIVGRLKGADTTGRRRETNDTSVTPANYSHPYYWSPFVLIGNWR